MRRADDTRATVLALFAAAAAERLGDATRPDPATAGTRSRPAIARVRSSSDG